DGRPDLADGAGGEGRLRRQVLPLQRGDRCEVLLAGHHRRPELGGRRLLLPAAHRLHVHAGAGARGGPGRAHAGRRARPRRRRVGDVPPGDPPQHRLGLRPPGDRAAPDVRPIRARQPPLSLAVAALTLAAQNGTVLAFGVLYLPLVADLGERGGAVAAVQAAVLVLGGLGAPLVGAALDRWGPRRLFQAGAVVAALGLGWASRVSTLPALVLAYGVVGGAGLAALGSTPNMVVVAQ